MREHQPQIQKYFVSSLVSAEVHVTSTMSARLAVTYTHIYTRTHTHTHTPPHARARAHTHTHTHARVTCGSKPVAACSLEVPDRCPVEGVHVPLPHVIQQHSPLSLHANNKQDLAWLHEVREAVSCERHLQSRWWHMCANSLTKCIAGSVLRRQLPWQLFVADVNVRRHHASFVPYACTMCLHHMQTQPICAYGLLCLRPTVSGI